MCEEPTCPEACPDSQGGIEIVSNTRSLLTYGKPLLSVTTCSALLSAIAGDDDILGPCRQTVERRNDGTAELTGNAVDTGRTLDQWTELLSRSRGLRRWHAWAGGLGAEAGRGRAKNSCPWTTRSRPRGDSTRSTRSRLLNLLMNWQNIAPQTPISARQPRSSACLASAGPRLGASPHRQI
jgi:hypothetical protein